MAKNDHRAHVYHSLDEYLAGVAPRFRRKATALWKRHFQRNGNTPLVVKCYICSGQERRAELKCGAYKPRRLSRSLRDERKEWDAS